MADEYLKSEKWVSNAKEFFVSTDLNKNGVVSLEDFELWIDNIKKMVNPDPSLLAKLKKVLNEYTSALGLKPGVKLTSDQFVQALAKFTAEEKAKGDDMLQKKMNHAWYDVVDTNHDGTISLDEYRKVMKACNYPEETADYVFKMIDANHDGKLSRKELSDHEVKFFFAVD